MGGSERKKTAGAKGCPQKISPAPETIDVANASSVGKVGGKVPSPMYPDVLKGVPRSDMFPIQELLITVTWR